MYIKNLTKQEFESFVENNILGNYYQTYEYALVMSQNEFAFEFVGLIDEYKNIRGASLILIKKLTSFFKYGYLSKTICCWFNDFNYSIFLLWKRYFCKWIQKFNS